VGHNHDGLVAPSRVRALRVGNAGVAPIVAPPTTLFVGGRGGCGGCCISGCG